MINEYIPEKEEDALIPEYSGHNQEYCEASNSRLEKLSKMEKQQNDSDESENELENYFSSSSEVELGQSSYETAVDVNFERDAESTIIQDHGDFNFDEGNKEIENAYSINHSIGDNYSHIDHHPSKLINKNEDSYPHHFRRKMNKIWDEIKHLKITIHREKEYIRQEFCELQVWVPQQIMLIKSTGEVFFRENNQNSINNNHKKGEQLPNLEEAITEGNKLHKFVGSFHKDSIFKSRRFNKFINFRSTSLKNSDPNTCSNQELDSVIYKEKIYELDRICSVGMEKICNLINCLPPYIIPDECDDTSSEESFHCLVMRENEINNMNELKGDEEKVA
ncbi:hypothetical protein LSTR_LSTR009143 [Laodelphax striatellus]|uniref:Uncharacterized protein n=1 Tax=Laodelphax striatellus TaxID=195883 RepID=A0A482XSJ9_LAOST|nr:hypothetical protein LSTR_LSTR009143 [Laodelphax striatellus]